jgi:hypothetical protein
MKLLTRILYPFSKPTILSTIKSEIPLEEEKIRQSEEMILHHEYEISLSAAKIVAMKNWLHEHTTEPASITSDEFKNYLEKGNTHDNHPS